MPPFDPRPKKQILRFAQDDGASFATAEFFSRDRAKKTLREKIAASILRDIQSVAFLLRPRIARTTDRTTRATHFSKLVNLGRHRGRELQLRRDDAHRVRVQSKT
jgi:hypothetical protein